MSLHQYVKVEGLRDTVRAAKNAPEEIGKGIKLVLRESAALVVPAAKTAEAHRRRSGRFERSIRVKVTRFGSAIGSSKPQAGVVQFGRRVGGKFARSNRPFPSLVRAVESKQSEVEAHVYEGMQRILDRSFAEVSRHG